MEYALRKLARWFARRGGANFPWMFLPWRRWHPASEWSRARLCAWARNHRFKHGNSSQNGISWTQARVTVLIVVHNNPRGVEETLTSAAAAIHRLSTQDGFEAPSGGIVVVDDGSTDETRHKLIQWMQAADVPVKLYCTAWQVGVSRARNLGLEAISTEWVCILDSDNTLHERGLVELLEHSGDGAGCFGSMWVCNRMKTMHELAGNHPFDFELLLREGPQMDSTALFRTEVLKGFGGYDEDLLLDIWGLEDFDLWLRLGEAGVSISHVSQPIGTLRRGADAHWSQFTRQTLGDAQRVFEGRFGSKFTAYKHESVP